MGTPGWVAIGDFNGDGKPDLADRQPEAAAVSVLLGNGNGTFQAPILLPRVRADSVALGDFNGDGKLDLAAVDSNDNFVGVLMGNGDGTLAPSRPGLAPASAFAAH